MTGRAGRSGVYIRTKKHNEKIGKITKKRYENLEEHEKTKKSTKKAYVDNPELRKQASIRAKKMWENPDHKERVRSSIKMLWEDVDWRKKTSIGISERDDTKRIESITRYYQSPEGREKQRIRSTELWKNPEYRNKVIQNSLQSNRIKPTKPELFVKNILESKYPNEWEYTGNGKCIIGGKNPDFTNCCGHKKLIEVYGDYWHRNDDPQDRIDLFYSVGYSCLIIWEHDIYDNPELVIEKIQKFLGNVI